MMSSIGCFQATWIQSRYCWYTLLHSNSMLAFMGSPHLLVSNAGLIHCYEVPKNFFVNTHPVTIICKLNYTKIISLRVSEFVHIHLYSCMRSFVHDQSGYMFCVLQKSMSFYGSISVCLQSFTWEKSHHFFRTAQKRGLIKSPSAKRPKKRNTLKIYKRS